MGERLTALPERHVKDVPPRFDVLVVDNIPGSPPELRLHKDAFSPCIQQP